MAAIASLSTPSSRGSSSTRPAAESERDDELLEDELLVGALKSAETLVGEATAENAPDTLRVPKASSSLSVPKRRLAPTPPRRIRPLPEPLPLLLESASSDVVVAGECPASASAE